MYYVTTRQCMKCRSKYLNTKRAQQSILSIRNVILVCMSGTKTCRRFRTINPSSMKYRIALNYRNAYLRWVTNIKNECKSLTCTHYFQGERIRGGCKSSFIQVYIGISFTLYSYSCKYHRIKRFHMALQMVCKDNNVAVGYDVITSYVHTHGIIDWFSVILDQT